MPLGDSEAVHVPICGRPAAVVLFPLKPPRKALWAAGPATCHPSWPVRSRVWVPREVASGDAPPREVSEEPGWGGQGAAALSSGPQGGGTNPGSRPALELWEERGQE